MLFSTVVNVVPRALFYNRAAGRQALTAQRNTSLFIYNHIYIYIQIILLYTKIMHLCINIMIQCAIIMILLCTNIIISCATHKSLSRRTCCRYPPPDPRGGIASVCFVFAERKQHYAYHLIDGRAVGIRLPIRALV